MSASARKGIAPAGWSIALHAVLAGMLYLGLSVPTQDPEPMTLPIDAVVMDQAVIQAASRQRRDDVRREEEVRQRDARPRRRRNANGRRTSDGPRKPRSGARPRRQRNRRRVPRRMRSARPKPRRSGARNNRRRPRRRRTRSVRPRRQGSAISAKRTSRRRWPTRTLRTGAAFQGLKASYVRAIQVHVEQRWYEPPGIASGMSCTVIVSQIPGGEVTGMRFGSCNGSPAVRQSIETAVRNSSPLPAPPEPALFSREVQLVFTPKESRR